MAYTTDLTEVEFSIIQSEVEFSIIQPEVEFSIIQSLLPKT